MELGDFRRSLTSNLDSRSSSPLTIATSENKMSQNELPEVEAGTIPLVVYAVAGIVGLFFVGLIGAVLMRDTGEQSQAKPQAESNLREQPDLLGPGDDFRVRFETTAGPFVVAVHPEWAPRGATQFREVVESGFYDGCRFFRVVPGFVVQFGINGDPAEHAQWKQPIADDPPGHSNTLGTVTFAISGPNTRTTQIFINLGNNGRLDAQGFSPFGEVVEGMENVRKINPEYGEDPKQQQIELQGNAYLEAAFPKLDYITSAKIVGEPQREESDF